MNDAVRTTQFVVIAVILATFAVTNYSSSRPPEVFDDQGEPFFVLGDEDATVEDVVGKIASLEVVSFDEETARLNGIKVEHRDGRWTIPTRHGYPADNRDQLSAIAAAVLTLERGSLRTSRQNDHKDYGVIDPLSEEVSDRSVTVGVGERIILRDEGGDVLADFILGDEVGEGRRYVRLPEEKQVYVADWAVEISTEVMDWIDRDLVGLPTTAAVGSITVQWVRREGRDPQYTDPIVLEQAGPDWRAEGQTEDEGVSVAAVGSMLTTLRDLTIHQVLPRGALPDPELRVRLRPDEEVVEFVRFTTSEGIRYTLKIAGETESENGVTHALAVLDVEVVPEALSPDLTEGGRLEALFKAEKRVEELKQRRSAWGYEISGSVERLRPTRDQLVRPADELRDAHEESLGGHEGHDHGEHDGHDHGPDAPSEENLFAPVERAVGEGGEDDVPPQHDEGHEHDDDAHDDDDDDTPQNPFAPGD